VYDYKKEQSLVTAPGVQTALTGAWETARPAKKANGLLAMNMTN
jgi:hypothetical protein